MLVGNCIGPFFFPEFRRLFTCLSPSFIICSFYWLQVGSLPICAMNEVGKHCQIDQLTKTTNLSDNEGTAISNYLLTSVYMHVKQVNKFHADSSFLSSFSYFLRSILFPNKSLSPTRITPAFNWVPQILQFYFSYI